MRKAIIVTGLIMLALCLGACGTTGSASKASTSSTVATPRTAAPTTSAAPTTTTTTPAPTTTTTKPTSELAVGQSQELTKSGEPYLTVTVAQLVDPATLSTTFATTPAGDEYVAVDWTFTNPGKTAFTTDINGDVKIYNAAGQGFTTSYYTTTAGPSFPSGAVNLAPGGTASGWTLFQVPTSSPLTKVEFTPDAGLATNVTTYWRLSG